MVYNSILKKPKEYFRDKNYKYELNSSFLENDTELFYYILGFITADGHINQTNRSRLVIGLSIKDKQFINKLVSFGLDQKKSTINKIFTKIPIIYRKDYIRGFFDGDGCFSFSSRIRGKYKSIEGTVSFTNLDYNFLNELSNSIGFGKVSKKRNHFVLRFQSTENILTFYKFIYYKSTIYLNRKKEKFQKFFELKDIICIS